MSNKGKCGIITVVAEAEAMVQDYDILLCAGKSRMSKRIQRYQKLFCDVSDEAARISHVAMVRRNWVNRIIPGEMSYRERFGYADVFESTTMNKWADKSGSQVNPLGSWIKNYNGDVYILPLKFERTDNHYCLLDRFIKRVQGMPYESGIPGLIEMALCGFPDVKNKPTDSPHCSEQDVRALQYAELFDSEAMPNKFPPCQFWPGGSFAENLADGVEVLEPLKIVV